MLGRSAITIAALLVAGSSVRCGGESVKDEGSGHGSRGGSGPLDGCLQPIDTRLCESTGFPVHDPLTGECEHSVDAMCPNNGNSFRSIADCVERCDAKPALTACDHSYECTLVSVGCCGACEPVPAADFLAINRTRVADYTREKGCDGVACGACADVDELETARQYLVPECWFNVCRVTDLRQTTATECTVNEDCGLRDGAGCCEPCDGTGLAALSSTAYLADLCDPTVDCAACEPQISPAYFSACVAGRCNVGRVQP